MKTQRDLACVCGQIPTLLRRGNGFVRYSAAEGREVGVYTSLHPYNLSSVMRVVYQIELDGECALKRALPFVDAANSDSTIGIFSLDTGNGNHTLRLLQLMWVDRRPTRESLEELLLAGEFALRALYSKITEGSPDH